jgi:hypothetical protein
VEITNVQVYLSSSYSDQYSLSCHCEGARYHIWVDRQTHKMEERSIARKGPVLFKNSLADHGQEGYYKTRCLDPTATFGSELIARMYAQANGNNLWDKADKDMRDREAEGMRQHRDAMRTKNIKEAGPEMFKVLEAIAEFWATNDPMPLSPGAYIMEDDIPIRDIVHKLVSAAPGCPDCGMSECECRKGLQHIG